MKKIEKTHRERVRIIGYMFLPSGSKSLLNFRFSLNDVYSMARRGRTRHHRNALVRQYRQTVIFMLGARMRVHCGRRTVRGRMCVVKVVSIYRESNHASMCLYTRPLAQQTHSPHTPFSYLCVVFGFVFLLDFYVLAHCPTISDVGLTLFFILRLILCMTATSPLR